MPRVLIISTHFPPSAASGSFRMLGFARHLPAFGWSVSVVACPRMPLEPTDPLLAREVPDQTSVHFADYPHDFVSRAYRKVLSRTRILDAHWTWCRAALKVCRRAVADDRPEAVLTSGPPHSVHLLGRRIRRELGLRWIADFRDPWVVNGRPLTRRDRIRSAIEQRVMSNADAIIANAPRAMELIQRAYPACAGKMLTVPNGYDPDTGADGGNSNTNDVSGETLEILHAGELYAGRDPRPFLQAVAEAEQETGVIPWRVEFLGRVDACGVDFPEECRRLRLRSTVSVAAQVGYAEAKRRMRRAGILLLMDGPGRRIGVPAKAYEYIGAGRPILALAEPDGDTAWALKTSGVPHRLASPNDPAAIRTALLGLSSEIHSGQQVRADSIEGPFTRRSTARALASLLDSLAGGSNVRTAATLDAYRSLATSLL